MGPATAVADAPLAMLSLAPSNWAYSLTMPLEAGSGPRMSAAWAAAVTFQVGQDFLSAVRSGSSSAASVAVLTTAEHRARAEGLLGGDVDLVLAAEKAPQETQRLLCALLDVSPRAAMRVLVRLDVRLDGAQSDKFLAQTEDISTSGMLVVTPKRYPVGSRARFALTLPIDPQPIQGEAEVTRHTDPASDRVRGMGFRFMAFAPADAERLQGYVNAVAGQTPKAR